MRRRDWAILVGLCVGAQAEAADPPPLAEYFRAEVARIEARPLAGIETSDAWKTARPQLQARLGAMLGLDMTTPRSPLHAVITGTVDRPDFVVETILFQSRPGLYVTANLYRPKTVDSPLPAVLYLCGHSQVEKDGVILGAKTHYQHHAAWYASNGYVCLILDTLQLGEIPGLHHGTSKFGLWWWPARGYTPAGVEAWNAVRAIDYLETRREVDRTKIGVTGRSGGGASTWWVAAIDDRVAAAVPVAGITDLRNHVVDGVIEGHCDCMYHNNVARWDFDVIAALVAPRPMLVENTDKDPIFPEDGVRRIYRRLETVYAWYGATDRLGLIVGKGGHVDTEEIRHPSFAFMDKWLKGVNRPIVEPDRHVPDELLKVLADNVPPADAINATIHETFLSPRPAPGEPSREAGNERLPRPKIAPGEVDGDHGVQVGTNMMMRIKIAAGTFAGWPTPDQAGPIDLKPRLDRAQDALRIRSYEYTSQPGIRLKYWTIERAAGLLGPAKSRVIVIDDESWRTTWGTILEPLGNPRPIGAGNGSPEWMKVRNRVLSGQRVVLIAPRGVGPSAWPAEKEKQIRRRFMLIGQTLDGMRVWDVVRGIEAWQSMNNGETTFAAKGDAASWLLWALVMRPETPGAVELTALAPSVHDGPAYLLLEMGIDMPQAVSLLYPREVRLKETPKAAWAWTRSFGDVNKRPDWPAMD